MLEIQTKLVMNTNIWYIYVGGLYHGYKETVGKAN